MVRDNEPNVNEIILRVEHTVGYLGPGGTGKGDSRSCNDGSGRPLTGCGCSRVARNDVPGESS